MSRYKLVYDEKGAAYEYVNGELVWARDDLANASPGQNGPSIVKDIEPFVSPIDGTVISGRAALREHCLKHNVVPTADLKGLPVKTFNQEHKSSPEYRDEMKRTIAEVIRSKY